MAERPADAGPPPSGMRHLRSRVDRAESLSPMETASLLRDVAAALDARAADSPPAALQPWPDRLHASASALCRAGLRISATLLDQDRFAHLTDPSLTSDQAQATVREFDRHLDTALEALIDLTGYDNPDQEYPDMASWFEFRCPNVVYGKHTMRSPDPNADREPPD